MLLKVKEPAIRVLSVFAPEAVRLTAMLDHAIVADRPILDVAGACVEMTRNIWIFPYHRTSAELTVFRH